MERLLLEARQQRGRSMRDERGRVMRSQSKLKSRDWEEKSLEGKINNVRAWKGGSIEMVV